MHLEKVFIKQPNILVLLKMELICVFPFLAKNSLKFINQRAAGESGDHV